jgi:O-antigen/teichoic acid export membrane protein
MTDGSEAVGTVDNPIAIAREREHHSWKTLRGGATAALAVLAAASSLGLAGQVLVSRMLGAAGYGAFTLSLSWVAVLSVLALFGQGNAVVRFVATYVQRGAWPELRGLRRGTRLITLASSLAVSAVTASVLLLLHNRLGRQLQLTMLGGCLLLPVLAQLQLSGALHRGLKRAASSGIFDGVVRKASFLILLTASAELWSGTLTAPRAMALTCLAALIALASSDWVLVHVWPGRSVRLAPRYETRSWLALGWQLLLLAGVGIVLERADVLLLGGLRGTAAVGPYYAAVQVAGVAGYGLAAVNTIIAPMIAERYAARDSRGLAALVRRGTRLSAGLTIAASAAAAALGKPVLGLFGPGFESAYVPLIIILAGQCMKAAFGPLDFLMTMTRFERQAPLFFAGGACLNVVLSILLIPWAGIIGAAVATALSTIAWNLAAFVFIRDQLGVDLAPLERLGMGG